MTYSKSDFKPGDKVRFVVEATVTHPYSNNLEVSFIDDDHEEREMAVSYSDVINDGSDAHKDPRGLVFEGTAEEFRGSGVGARALDYARQLTEDDNKTRTVLVVPGTSVDHALSFVNVGVRQVRHAELREEQSRLNL